MTAKGKERAHSERRGLQFDIAFDTGDLRDRERFRRS